MHTATVDDKGTLFTYLDSGAVSGDTYTTLVMVHGHTYHARKRRLIIGSSFLIFLIIFSETFKKLIPLASKCNLRVVALNRRDYAGSTPCSSEELAALDSADSDAHKSFLTDRGLEIARFMTWFIRKHGIPKASEDGTSGGIALMGWSAGNITTLAFLSYVDSYPSEVIEALDPYVRTQIIFGNVIVPYAVVDTFVKCDSRYSVHFSWVLNSF